MIHGGVSHGATAPIMSALYGNVLNSAQYSHIWTAPFITAFMMFDGDTNTGTWEPWLAAQNTTSCTDFHYREVGRYGNGSPLTHSCANAKCFCSDPPNINEWYLDIAQVGGGMPTNTYTCLNFSSSVIQPAPVLYYFGSCPGAFNNTDPCNQNLGDIIPTFQQLDAFDSLQNCSNSSVMTNHTVFPGCPHSSCGNPGCGFEAASSWFKLQFGLINHPCYGSPPLPLNTDVGNCTLSNMPAGTSCLPACKSGYVVTVGSLSVSCNVIGDYVPASAYCVNANSYSFSHTGSPSHRSKPHSLPSHSSTHHSNSKTHGDGSSGAKATSEIVGAVVGVTVGAAVLILLLFLFKRHRDNKGGGAGEKTKNPLFAMS